MRSINHQYHYQMKCTIFIFALTILSCFTIRADSEMTDQSQSRTPSGSSIFYFLSDSSKYNCACKFIIDSTKWWEYKTIVKVDSIIKMTSLSQKSLPSNLLVYCLSDSLNKSKWNSNNLDTLSLLLTTSEHFQCYAEANPISKTLFIPISLLLCDLVSEKLAMLSENDISLKYNRDFYKIYKHSCELKCSPPLSYNDTEKAFIYITEQKWKYLLVDRLWHGTNFYFKLKLSLITAVFGLLTIFGVIHLFNFFKSKTL